MLCVLCVLFERLLYDLVGGAGNVGLEATLIVSPLTDGARDGGTVGCECL